MKPMIGIANTDFELIERCHKVLNDNGIGNLVSNKYRLKQKNNSPQKAIFVVGFNRVKKFIEVFGEHIQKKDRLNCLKELIDYRLSVHRKILYGSIEDTIFDKLKNFSMNT